MNQLRFMSGLCLILFSVPFVSFAEEGASELPDSGINIEAYKTLVSNLLEIANVPGVAAGAALGTLANSVANQANTCATTKDTTLNACDDTRSPLAQKAITTMQTYGTLVAMLVSSKNACSDIAKAMKDGNAILQLYQDACSGAKATCDSTCNTATSTLNAIPPKVKVAVSEIKQLQSANCGVYPTTMCGTYTSALTMATQKQTEIESTVKQELAVANLTVGSKKAYCAGQAARSKEAIAAQSVQAIQLLAQGNTCAAQTAGTGADSTEAYCRANPTAAQCDCNIATQASTQRCICAKDPRIAGCPNSLTKANSAGSDGLKVGTGGDLLNTGSAAGVPLPGQDQLEENKINIPKPQALAADSTGGGGSGGGPGSSGGSGSGNQFDKTGAGAKALGAPSSLGGWGSSSGGGGFGGGGRSSEDPLDKYGPGKEKDPKRKISAMGIGSEVTSQGGKSNWEKVKQRYMDKTPTLLGN